MSIWQELRNRKVLKVAAAYIVIAWVLLQVAATLEETLELPVWFDKAIFAAMLIGFPIALLLAWAYEIVPDTGSSDSGGKPVDSTFLIVMGAAILVAGAHSAYLWRDVQQPVSYDGEVTIAVLPFADMSPSGDQSWFADGISEEILNVLAKTEGMKVASRTSSFQFRGDDVDIKTVADQLGVSVVLEGSVRTQDQNLRITAQLINAADGFHIWSDTFDRELLDIFVVQEEISTSIARALFGELGFAALPEVRSATTQNLEAYNHYLRGLEKLNRNYDDFNDVVSSIADFELAVAADPGFADAWAALARADRMRRIFEQSAPSVSHALRKALALDPNNGLTIAELAQQANGDLQWLFAEQLFLRSIELAPDSPFVHRRYASFLRTSGRIERALQSFLKAAELGSDNRFSMSDIVVGYATLGRFAEARQYFEDQWKERDLTQMTGKEAYFVSLLADGMEAEAREFAALDTPGSSSHIRMEFFLDRLEGDPEAANKLIAETEKRIRESGVVRWGDVENHIMAGDIETARKLLPETLGYAWSVPRRMTLYISDEVDPRYLPYRANMLLLIDQFPGVPEAFLEIGIDIIALGRERGYIN